MINKKNLKGGLAVVAILLGAYLAFFAGPGREANKTIGAVEQTLSFGGATSLPKVQLELKSQTLWFTSSYTQGLKETLDDSERKLTKARESLESAKKAFWPGTKKKYALEASALVEKDAVVAISQVQKKLQTNKDAKLEAQRQWVEIYEGVAHAKNNYQVATERLGEEGSNYLSKYTKGISSTLGQAQKFVDGTARLSEESKGFLPFENFVEKLGDPIKASQLLTAAKDQLKNGRTLVDGAINLLDQYKEALDNADEETVASTDKIKGAKDHLQEVIRARKFSPDLALKQSVTHLSAANEALSDARRALTVKIENKHDYILAYSDAQKASTLAQQSYLETDRQVGLADSANSKIAEFKSRITNSQTAVQRTQQDLNVLRTYHAPQTWSNVSKNLDQAWSKLNTAQDSLREAERLANLEVQKFSEAVVAADQALSLVSSSSQLVQAVSTARRQLEEYRGEWSSVERSASATISHERSQIDSYGRYDSSAQSAFNSAQSYLAQARSSASQRFYQEAVEKAQQAKKLASGTGEQAYRAYEDKKAEERRAEERRRESNSGSSGWDWGSSGSSGGGSIGGGSSGNSSGGDGGDQGGQSGGGDGGDFR